MRPRAQTLVRILHSLQRNGVVPKDRKLDPMIQSSLDYELVNGLLYRRVYDIQDDETQLRCVAPEGDWQVIEDVGVGPAQISFRRHLLMHYHNSPLSGHRGRDKTNHELGKDWWWPGM